MPDRYAVIGNPVVHSKSPLIHAEFARQTAQDIVYVRLPVPKRSFRIELDRFMAHGGRGLNITVPFKEEAAAACTQLSERAKFAQAANTLTLAEGKVIGDNTDGAGMLRDLENNLHIAVHGRRVLLMAPIHHHFELLGWSETKIIVRFWITAAICSAIGFTLYQQSIGA